LLYGDMIQEQDYHTGVLFSLDFEKLHPCECVGADTPDAPGSDFEQWEVSNGTVCTMGMHTKYIRRKADVACFNSDEHPVNKRTYTQCACTREDFECGPCYVTDEQENCVALPTCETPTMDEQCVHSCYYYTNFTDMRYFKVAGDQCVGGLNLVDNSKMQVCSQHINCVSTGGRPSPSPSPTSNTPIVTGTGNTTPRPSPDTRTGSTPPRPTPTTTTPAKPTQPTQPSNANMGTDASASPQGGSGGTVAVVIVVVILVGLIGALGVVCGTKRPARVYAALRSIVPWGQPKTRKLGGLHADTASLFADDEFAQREAANNE